MKKFLEGPRNINTPTVNISFERYTKIFRLSSQNVFFPYFSSSSHTNNNNDKTTHHEIKCHFVVVIMTYGYCSALPPMYTHVVVTKFTERKSTDERDPIF